MPMNWFQCLRRWYASAPEDNELVLSDGTLGRMELTDPDGGVIGSYLGLHAAENARAGLHQGFRCAVLGKKQR